MEASAGAWVFVAIPDGFVTAEGVVFTVLFVAVVFVSLLLRLVLCTFAFFFVAGNSSTLKMNWVGLGLRLRLGGLECVFSKSSGSLGMPRFSASAFA